LRLTEPVPYARLARLRAELTPDAPAVAAEGRTLRWAELDRRTNRAAHALLARGVKTDDLVTIALPNGLSFIEACFACWKAGATPQPVSPRLAPPELAAVIELANPPLVIAGDELASDRPRADYDALLAASFDESAPPEVIASSYKAPTSGGSTGRPKLIVSTQPAIARPETPTFWRLDESDVALMPGPLYHNGPFVTSFAALNAGAHLVILPRFDAETVLQAVERHRATWLYLVPTMMSRIWRLPPEVRTKYDVSSLRTVWHLAAPCPAWLKEAWIDWLGPQVIWELYAATEGLAGTMIDGADWLTHRGSVGRVATGAIRILDANGAEVSSGTTGEVFMKQPEGAPATYRYVGAEARRRDEWHSLGDLGWMDAEGYLYLSDRRADLILVGGSNVYPAEVEAALEEHPLVQSCVVIGLPDDDLGARVHAIVQPHEGLEVEALRAFIVGRLVSYKRPRSYEFSTSPLRDEAGKVRRSQLIEERLAAQGPPQ
jgi:bile acid-coenzyme A ligase